MKILITGHQGFIGKNLAEWLKQKHEVLGYEWHKENLPLIKDFDWVIHLGAISDTTERDVNKILSQNYDFSKWLYNQCKIYGVNLQYASSASVYGSTTEFKETLNCDPQSPYAWSKFLFDRWSRAVHDNSFICQGFRYFNVYGPHEEHKGNQASPVYKFTKQAVETTEIQLFENSENYKRDFVFVGDVCNIHEKMLDVDKSGIWNIGTGTAISFDHVAKLVAKQKKALIKHIKMPENLKNQYQTYTCSDNTKLLETISHEFIKIDDYIASL